MKEADGCAGFLVSFKSIKQTKKTQADARRGNGQAIDNEAVSMTLWLKTNQNRQVVDAWKRA